MTPKKFDVVILGGGNAGIGVTGPVRRAGMSVAMIEAGSPRRHLSEPRLHAEEGAGRRRSRAARNRARLRPSHRRRQAEARLGGADRPREGHDQGYSGQPRPLDGQAQCRGHQGPWRLRWSELPSASATAELEAKHIVIATGSKPRPLPIPGAEHMITSDEMLSERELPGSVIFVGGGVIALEFGHVYARAGASVTILEALPQLLPAMDADAVARICRPRASGSASGSRPRVSVKRIEPAQRPPARRLHPRRRRARRRGRPRRQRRRPHRQCRYARSRRGQCRARQWPRRASTVICARPPTPTSMSAATRCRPRRSCRRSRPMRATSSAATSSRARNTAPTTPAWRHRSTPCRRSPRSA